MRCIGFSTGAIARGDFRRALDILRQTRVDAVELSALRIEELDPLCSAIPSLDLSAFTFVSVHAPSRFTREQESAVVGRLLDVARLGYPWSCTGRDFQSRGMEALGGQLLVENMDKRKPIGRTAAELGEVFSRLPLARFCFDIGHARQVDPSMIEASLLLQAFGGRLAEVHMSEVNTASRHDPISRYAAMAFRPVMAKIDPSVPIILEPLIDQGQSDVESEIARARSVFERLAA